MYASLEQANELLANDPVRRSTWGAVSDEDKLVFLTAATNRMNILSWVGNKTDFQQSDAWPRTGVSYPTGQAVADDIVPIEVVQASIYLAGTIAIDPTASGPVEDPRIKTAGAGAARVEFFRGRNKPTNKLEDTFALQLIGIFLTNNVGIIAGKAFGADKKSAFSDPYPFDKYRGN